MAEILIAILSDELDRLRAKYAAAMLDDDFRGISLEFLKHIEDDFDRNTVRALLRSSKPAICRAFDWMNSGRKIERWIYARRIMYYALLGDFRFPEIDNLVQVGRITKALPIFTRDDCVVGLGSAVCEVIELLRSNSETLEIISIVGRPGLGKTTLAKMVLYNPLIAKTFPERVLVRVSQDYDAKEIFLQILCTLTQVTPVTLDEMSEEKLAAHVSKQLDTKKYLIVMDDVTGREDWDKLKCALSNNKKGSRVIITTRRKYVAAHANPCIKPIYLGPLSSYESRELLRIRMKYFDERDASQIQWLSEFEHSIVTKCNGLPLAILLVSGSLWGITDRISDWRRVANSLDELSYEDEDHCKTLINWVFDHLAPYLKLCFLYLGIFPMDLEIPVSKLSQLWIAEGFIPHEGDMALEDRAECFLEELLVRNLVDVAQRKLNGRIKTCRLNGTIREFCKEKALKANLFQEINKGNQPLNHDQRRICINSNLFDYLSTITSPESTVRSFLASTKNETTLSPEHLFFICKSFKLLKVLDVLPFIFTSFPLELCQLVLLKYLAVSGRFQIIPSKISSLKFMQTLIVETTMPTLEVSANIWKLRQLRHLLTNASTSLPSPAGFQGKNNENLQTLSVISPESCKAGVFDMTRCLRKLGISGLALYFDGNDNFRGLRVLDKLEKLKLRNTHSSRGFDSLPDVAYFPPQLKKLTLINTLLPWVRVSALVSLRCLETLKLKDNACVGDFWQIDATFPTLKSLYIGGTNLKRWEASAAEEFPFPSLESLFLHHCTALESIPESLAGIATLKVIDLYDTNSRLVNLAREIEALSSSQFKLFIK